MGESHIAIRTLIPEASSYGIAILVVLCLSSFSLAAMIRSRWLAGRKVGIIRVYCGVLGLTNIWGLLVLDSSWFLGTSALAWALSLPVGVAAGRIAGWSDRAIIRSINRRSVIHRQRNDRAKALISGVVRSELRSIRPSSVPLAGQLTKRKGLGTHRVGQDFQPSVEARDAGVWALVVAAALEELVYRGFLVSVCFLLPGTGWTAIALGGIVIAFALSHIWFGWVNVLAKFPLGAATMVTVLVLGTVFPAIVAHVFFNFSVWNDRHSDVSIARRLRRFLTT